MAICKNSGKTQGVIDVVNYHIAFASVRINLLKIKVVLALLFEKKEVPWLGVHRKWSMGQRNQKQGSLDLPCILLLVLLPVRRLLFSGSSWGTSSGGRVQAPACGDVLIP